MSEYKTCIECAVSYEATERNFHKSKDGLHGRCRKCRNRKMRGDRKGGRRNRRLEEIEKGAVDLFIASSRIGGANIPHSSELLEILMEYFGGVRGFANAYMKQFYDSPVGGAFRTKMLETVVRLTVGNTAMGGAKKPLELMSEEELDSELRRQILEAAMTYKKVEVVDEVQRLPVVEASGSGGDAVGPVPSESSELGGPGNVRVSGDGPSGLVR